MKVIRVRGIGEPLQGNLLSHVTALVPGAEVVELPYEATYGPAPSPFGRSFKASVAWGETLLRRELDKGPAFVLGFSGGAVVAGNVAAAGHPNLLGVVLVADPCMPPRGGVLSRFGIAGARWIPEGVPRLWVWRTDDPIPWCPSDSPLRTFSDQSSAFALGDARGWTTDLLDRLNRQRWQKIAIRFWEPNVVWQQYTRAITDVGNYFRNHPNYAHEYVRIADWIKEHA